MEISDKLEVCRGRSRSLRRRKVARPGTKRDVVPTFQHSELVPGADYDPAGWGSFDDDCWQVATTRYKMWPGGFRGLLSVTIIILKQSDLTGCLVRYVIWTITLIPIARAWLSGPDRKCLTVNA